jgi:DNA-binding NtrC family response regulator
MEQLDVLIVGNNRPVRDILHQAFVVCGYTCALTSDGEEALEVLRNSRPSLVITDLITPAMSGIGLTQRVRQENPDVAVIVLTDAVDVKSAIESLGAYALSSTALNIGELLSAAERALGRRRHGAAPRQPRETDSAPRPGTIEDIESFVSYFESCSRTEPLFLPELEVATQVIRLMKQKDRPGAATEIVTLMSSLDRRPHYDGTGWYGFCGAVRCWLDAHLR